jgi:hypothetical protein
VRWAPPRDHDLESVPGHHATLREITEDIADARIYGGIHFRFDQEEGAEQGRQVGEYIYRHYLEPRHDQDNRQR